MNVTLKGVCLPISKLHSILDVENLFVHNNISEIFYCGQISLESAAVNYSFSDNLTPLGVAYILLMIIIISLITNIFTILSGLRNEFFGT